MIRKNDKPVVTWKGKPLPWAASNQRDQQRMVEWVLDQLDQLDLETYRLNNAKPKPFAFKALSGRRSATPHQAEIAASERCDIKLLRRMFPLHARCINMPKSTMGRGHHLTKKPKKYSHATWAALDVRRIRQLWQESYGKKNRKDLRPTAVEIAMERWAEPWGDPTTAQIDRALKKLPKL